MAQLSKEIIRFPADGSTTPDFCPSVNKVGSRPTKVVAICRLNESAYGYSQGKGWTNYSLLDSWLSIGA